MNTELLVQKYRELRDMRDRLKKRHAEELAPISEMMSRVEALFLQHLDDQKTSSMATEAGTIYRSTKTKASVADWDAVLAYIIEHSAWELLPRSVNDVAAAERFENGEPIPGVDLKTFMTVGVRKPTTKK